MPVWLPQVHTSSSRISPRSVPTQRSLLTPGQLAQRERLAPLRILSKSAPPPLPAQRHQLLFYNHLRVLSIDAPCAALDPT